MGRIKLTQVVVRILIERPDTAVGDIVKFVQNNYRRRQYKKTMKLCDHGYVHRELCIICTPRLKPLGKSVPQTMHALGQELDDELIKAFVGRKTKKGKK